MEAAGVLDPYNLVPSSTPVRFLGQNLAVFQMFFLMLSVD